MITQSKIHGLGFVVDRAYTKGELIHEEKILRIPMAYKDIWEVEGLAEYTAYDKQTPNYFVYFIGQVRFINHSPENSNCKLVFRRCGMVEVYATKTIPCGSEILLDYSDM